MLKIFWKSGEIAPEEQFLLLSTIFCYLMLDFYVKTRIRFSLRDKRLFEITEVEITRSTVLTCVCFYSKSERSNARVQNPFEKLKATGKLSGGITQPFLFLLSFLMMIYSL